MRARVDCVIEEIAAHAAEIEQRVAFGGRTVADDTLALGFGVDQEREQRALGAGHGFGKTFVAVDAIEPGGALLGLDRRNRRADRAAAAMAAENPQRAAV